MDEHPREDLHHRSSFLPPLGFVENHIETLITPDVVPYPQYPILTCNTVTEGNLVNIGPTIPIDISTTPQLVEYIHIGHKYSPEELTSYTTLFLIFEH